MAKPSPSLQRKLQLVVQSKNFQHFILGLIVLAAILVGIETYPEIVARYGVYLSWINELIIWLFVIEAAMKMGQHGRHFYRYFKDPWNIFDFLIIVVCFLPVDAQYAAVLRLARIIRALRLVTAVPKLQLIVSALLKSIPSMGYIGLLLALHFYVYAVLAVFLFRDNDPVHFRDLQTAMLSLFRVVTLEDWTDVMYIQMYGSDVYPYTNTTGIETIPKAQPLIGAVFFVSFVMLGTWIMLNLFIGVILNSMDEAQEEARRSDVNRRVAHQRATGQFMSIGGEVRVIEQQVEQLQKSLNDLRLRIEFGRDPDQ
ncbi:Voltage-gated sodium channel subunit [Planctomycetales bacterium 10988]|nr:Voltage-gated sodium channel subunit [Planctomycetales bacterium 10988]